MGPTIFGFPPVYFFSFNQSLATIISRPSDEIRKDAIRCAQTISRTPRHGSHPAACFFLSGCNSSDPLVRLRLLDVFLLFDLNGQTPGTWAEEQNKTSGPPFFTAGRAIYFSKRTHTSAKEVCVARLDTAQLPLLQLPSFLFFFCICYSGWHGTHSRGIVNNFSK